MNKKVNYHLVSFKHFVANRFLSVSHLIFQTLCDTVFIYFIQQILVEHYYVPDTFCSYGLFAQMKCVPPEQENKNNHKFMNRIISGSGQCFEGSRTE